LYQARLALGSGGLFGVGLGASRQKFAWLPAAHNDAIFAVIGEELGLIGCCFLLSLFVVVAYRGYRVALHAPDALGALIAVGVTTWLVFQAAFNIGGVTLAIPFTGIPLPFISAGGTALVVAMTSMGVLLNVSRQTLSSAVLQAMSRPRDDLGVHQPAAVAAAQIGGRAARLGDWTEPVPVVSYAHNAPFSPESDEPESEPHTANRHRLTSARHRRAGRP
jgi:hypothetical protein